MPYKDPEKGKAYREAWYVRNKDRLAGIRREWYLNNQDKVKAGQERNAVRRKVRMNERKPEINARRRWRYANEQEYRDKIKVRSRSRSWDILPEEYDAFMAMYDEDCFYCGNEGGAVDHLMPRSRGGEDRLYNLVPVCQPCNSSKGTKTPEEWYASGFDFHRPSVAKPKMGSGTDSHHGSPISPQDPMVFGERV